MYRSATTVEELERLGSAGDHCELADGVLVRMNPPSFEHGRIAGQITALLVQWVSECGLGTVVVESGFILQRAPDVVRAPDVAFVRAGRPGFPPAKGFASGAPDLAVEIASPDETAAALAAKAAEYLDAGASLVWVIDPEGRAAREYRPGSAGRDVVMLDGGPLLAHLQIPIDTLFH